MQKDFETQRLILKVLDGSYADAVLEYNIRNKDFLQEWEPSKSLGYYTKEYQEVELEFELKSFYKGSSLKLWIFKKEETSKIIGCIIFNNIIRGAFLSCHLGYKLDKDEINNGYVTESVEKGIDIIFNKYCLHRIEANIMPRNTRSLRVVKKLGFYNEGIAKNYLKINGKWEDHIHMVLLNDKE